MLRDKASHKRMDRLTVQSAISALQQRGEPVTLDTVATEARLQISAIYRDPELLEMISEAGGVVERRGITLEQAKKRISELEVENRDLLEKLAIVEEEILQLSRTSQEAWQSGYEAALKELDRLSKSSEETLSQDNMLGDIAGQEQVDFNPELSGVFADSIDDGVTFHSYEDTENALRSLSMGPELSNFLLSAAQENASQDFSDQNIEQSQAHPGYSGGFDPFQNDEHLTCYQNSTVEGEFDSEGQQADEFGEEDGSVSENDLRNLVQQRNERRQEQEEAAREAAREVDASKGLASKVFQKASGEETTSNFVVRSVPPDIRKSCMILGIKVEDLSFEKVHNAWRQEITKPGVHPDHGGDPEIAVFLNTAKDTLFQWLDTQAPKLGKTFGKLSKDSPKKKSEQELE